MCNIKISFGALSPQISTQLEDQGLTIDPETIAEIQKHADAITRLYLHGILSGSAKDKCRDKLFNIISEHVRPPATI